MRLLVFFLAALLFAAQPADAAPVAAAFTAITSAIGAATGFAAFALKVGASFLLSSLARMLRDDPSANVRRSGIKTDATTTGGTNSETFVLGKYATGGNMVAPPYSRDNTGDSPNLLLTYVVDVSDLPGVELSRLIVAGKYIDDLQPQVGDPEYEYEGNFHDVGHGNHPFLWLNWHDGTQTTVDPYMIKYYASHSERPWASNMVGEGIAYAVVTFYRDSSVYTGFPSLRFEVKGIPLYDPRKDTSVGGSGSHRWANKATWEYTENPAVMIYNILRGIEMPGGRIWGGHVDADDLPLSNWFAAMNDCDESVTLKGGGTEAKYRAGYEVRTADDEPAEVINELLKACAGEISEVGGVYKMRVGPPALPVYSFTDDDVIADQEETLIPFPGLDSVYNAIHATHPDPDMQWETRDAPPRYNSTWEDEDGDRQLVADVSLPAVASRRQVQQLMKGWIEDERRFVGHRLSLPPVAAALEPLDVVSYTSTRSGYTAKAFEVSESIIAPRTMLNTLTMREREQGDWDWDTSDEEEVDTPSTVKVQPAARTVPGWAVVAWQVKDAGGTGRKSAIKIKWTGDEVSDAQAIEYQLRSDGQTDLAATGNFTDLESGEGIIVDGVLPDTDMEVRARLVMRHRTRAWTSWTDVTTPDLRVTSDDLDDDLTTSGVPTGLSLSSTLIKDGVASIVATWTGASGAVSYDVGIKRTGGNEVIKKAGGTRYEFETQPGAEFDIRVRGISATGEPSAWTTADDITAALDSTPPAVPTGVTATAGFGVMWLTWNANTEADLSHYEILQKTNNTAPTSGTAATFSAAGTAASVSGLANTTQYWFWVRAVDTSGNKSDWSISDDATTAGTPPANVTNASLIGLVDASSFAASLSAVDIVASLPSSGNYEGRVAYLKSDGKLYRYDGSGWTAATDGADVIANSLTGGALTAAAIGTRELAAYAATMEKLAIGDFRNYAAGSTGNWDNHSWNLGADTFVAGGLSHSPGNSIRFAAGAGVSILKTKIECIAGQQYRLSFWVRPDANVTGMTFASRVNIRFYDDADVEVAQPGSFETWSGDPLATWTEHALVVTVPTGAVRIRVQMRGDQTTGNTYIDDITFMPVVDGVFIAEGGITAKNLTLTGEVITQTAQVKTGIITDAHIVDLVASKIRAGTQISGSVTVSGTALSTVESRADDPAARINGKSTQIDPGKIVISGGTTLADWRKAGDVTKIDGGSLSNNTVTTNSLDTTDFAASGLAVFGGTLKSSNFVGGSDGWRIKNDGSAEFSDVIIRRQLEVASGTETFPEITFSVTASPEVQYTKWVYATGEALTEWAGADHTYIALVEQLSGDVEAPGGAIPNIYWGWTADVMPLTKWSGDQTIRLRLRYWAQNVTKQKTGSVKWKLYKVT